MAAFAEQLSQDEIDSLMRDLSGKTEVSSSFAKDQTNQRNCKRRFRDVIAAKERYAFALENLSFEAIKDARRYLHYAAFELWLVNHKLTKKKYPQYLKELVKNANTFDIANRRPEVI